MAKEQTYAERRDAIMDGGRDTTPAEAIPLKQKGAELMFVRANISHENKVTELLKEIRNITWSNRR
ncbi:MAG: hypothetical protein GY862_14035 [Gammaproteobacteria bacterium]|nr:hypothetical protein [Gammaproteobacteria bacterium]